jgi:hypothetical protein
MSLRKGGSVLVFFSALGMFHPCRGHLADRPGVSCGPMGARPAVPLRGLADGILNVDPRVLRHARAVVRIGLVEVADLARLDLPRHGRHGTDDAVQQPGLSIRPHEAVEVARLGIVVVARPVVVRSASPETFSGGSR